MAYNTRSIKKDVDGRPIPQYFNQMTDNYEPLLGEYGAARSILWGPNGQPLSVIDNKLAVRAADLETLIGALNDSAVTNPANAASVIAALKGLLSVVGKEATLGQILSALGALATETTLGGVKTAVDVLAGTVDTQAGVQKVALSGSIPAGANLIGRVQIDGSKTTEIVRDPLILGYSSHTLAPFVIYPFGGFAKDPSVIRHNGKYYMFYSYRRPDNRWEIRWATSTDLIHWEWQGVAIPPGDSGAWDDEQAVAPAKPILLGGTWYLYYTGHNANSGRQRIGYATTTDIDSGNWTKHPNPVTSAFTRLDPFILFHNGAYHMFYTGSEGSTNDNIYYCTSTDLQTWSPEQRVEGAYGEGAIVLYNPYVQKWQMWTAGPRGAYSNTEEHIRLFSASSLTGPYTDEGKAAIPVDSLGQSAYGHGDIIEVNPGEWWLFFQQTWNAGLNFVLGVVKSFDLMRWEPVTYAARPWAQVWLPMSEGRATPAVDVRDSLYLKRWEHYKEFEHQIDLRFDGAYNASNNRGTGGIRLHTSKTHEDYYLQAELHYMSQQLRLQYKKDPSEEPVILRAVSQAVNFGTWYRLGISRVDNVITVSLDGVPRITYPVTGSPVDDPFFDELAFAVYAYRTQMTIRNYAGIGYRMS